MNTTKYEQRLKRVKLIEAIDLALLARPQSCFVGNQVHPLSDALNAARHAARDGSLQMVVDALKIAADRTAGLENTHCYAMIWRAIGFAT